VARGFNRDNPALIEGTDGLIIVDPGESIPAAQAVKSAFNAELDNIFDRKPVKAVIYTHSHDCHIHGAAVFADSETEIIAHEALMKSLFDEWYGQAFPSRLVGGAMMGGILFQNAPALGNKGWYTGYVLTGANVLGPSGFLPPTRTVRDRLETTIAGIEINLISAPGETQDIIIVWLPEKEVLIEIGLIYEAFPALTTMRGSRQRDALDYVNSLKLCRSLNPEYMVALHGPNPVTTGADNIREYLTNFSDAIQYLNDQTVQYMNRGFTAGEMMDLIVLPPHLASSPYLQETYGTKEWDIVHLFRYYRGYYTGEVRDLFPQSTQSEAGLSAMLAGGVDALAVKAEEARLQGSLEWALRLADDVLVLEPENAAAFETKKAAMLALAEETMSSQARNMLLSEYLLMTGQLQSPYPLGDPVAIFARMGEGAVELMPLETLHRIMSVSLNASKSLEMDVTAALQLTGTEGNAPDQPVQYKLNVRRGILEVDPPYDVGEQFGLITDTLTWKQLVLGKLTPRDAVASGAVVLSGGIAEDFYAFMDLFR
ncbi:MAG: MBL fold metallo-hydrolase, partial [Clostridiales bacterium]|nr:MBL fold metallo-hydrolase [Clostridiales bacterium]